MANAKIEWSCLGSDFQRTASGAPDVLRSTIGIEGANGACKTATGKDL
jgi:hypothetical protein